MVIDNPINEYVIKSSVDLHWSEKCLIEIPAFLFMALDIVREVLKYSDNFNLFVQKLTGLLRELTGARAVMLFENSELRNESAIIFINPERSNHLKKNIRIGDVKKLFDNKNEASILRYMDAPSGFSDFLRKNGFLVNMVCPVSDHRKLIGGIIAFGLVDNKGLKLIVEVLDVLLETVVLVLRNAQLIKNQDLIIQDRTKEIEKAKNLAEFSNKAKSEFLAGITRGFRTPLNTVIGYSNLLLRDDAIGKEPLSRRQSENLSIINRSGEHLLLLINNVLELSRIEADQLKISSLLPILASC